MTMSWQRMAMVAMVGAYLLVFGALAGVAVERMRFDAKRSAVIRDYETAAGKARGLLMTLERRASSAASAREVQ